MGNLHGWEEQTGAAIWIFRNHVRSYPNGQDGISRTPGQASGLTAVIGPASPTPIVPLRLCFQVYFSRASCEAAQLSLTRSVTRQRPFAAMHLPLGDIDSAYAGLATTPHEGDKHAAFR